MTAEPVPSRRVPRVLVLAAAGGLVVLALGAYLVASGWPTTVGYPADEWFAYGPDEVVGLSVAGPSAGFVVGIVLVAVGAGVIGAVVGSVVTRARRT